jgi:transcriptional repressor NrdR
MLCPFCKDKNTKVVDKRDSDEISITRRRRECIACGKRFTTYEKAESPTVKVLKKDGSLQHFDKEKIIKGIKIAAQKRISDEEIENIADEIEIKMINRKSNKVSASDIGRLVMNRLKKMDKIAYIRFASVYLGFENIEDFKEALDNVA